MRWVYGKDGSSKIVTPKEADKLYLTGEFADNPAGPFEKAKKEPVEKKTGIKPSKKSAKKGA